MRAATVRERNVVPASPRQVASHAVAAASIVATDVANMTASAAEAAPMPTRSLGNAGHRVGIWFRNFERARNVAG